MTKVLAAAMTALFAMSHGAALAQDKPAQKTEEKAEAKKADEKSADAKTAEKKDEAKKKPKKGGC